MQQRRSEDLTSNTNYTLHHLNQNEKNSSNNNSQHIHQLLLLPSSTSLVSPPHSNSTTSSTAQVYSRQHFQQQQQQQQTMPPSNLKNKQVVKSGELFMSTMSAGERERWRSRFFTLYSDGELICGLSADVSLLLLPPLLLLF